MRSAKTTVTTFRATVSSVVWAGRERGDPQLRQNFAAGPHTLPHDGQRLSSRAPHSSQKEEPTGFSYRQAAQIMIRILDDSSTLAGFCSARL